jgi:diphthine-ammonia ligase
MKVVAAWSGGKDSCFACYKAVQIGLDVSSLVTFVTKDGESNFHKLHPQLLDAQSHAVGIPLVKQATTWDTYEREFKNAINKLKATGIEGLVTGDIYEVALHEQGWLERVCRELKITPIRPLWQGNTKKILEGFITEGFKATVVKVKTELLGEEWLGRELNMQFLNDIVKLGNVDPCGEGGEYHTFVTDGPSFKESIRILETKKMAHDGYGHLEIKRFEVKPKKTRP